MDEPKILFKDYHKIICQNLSGPLSKLFSGTCERTAILSIRAIDVFFFPWQPIMAAVVAPPSSIITPSSSVLLPPRPSLPFTQTTKPSSLPISPKPYKPFP
uniref:Uncharacterized protein n=1 Tax=Opuntia streptacantha TaxID=393608 RepID=A0A7C9F742_OPUST